MEPQYLEEDKLTNEHECVQGEKENQERVIFGNKGRRMSLEKGSCQLVKTTEKLR